MTGRGWWRRNYGWSWVVVEKKKLYSPFLWIGFNCLIQSHYAETVYFLPISSQKFLHDRPRKDKRLGRSWSHPVVLNTGHLDWKSNALTTRSLFSPTLFLGNSCTMVVCNGVWISTPQSINSLVRVGHPPKFRIKKSDIFGVEK